MKNYYEVLGISQSATQEEIQSRYRFLAKVFHPDRFTELEAKQQAENEMKQINEAYTVLSSPAKREEYDRKIGGKAGQGSSQKSYSGDAFDEKKTDELIAFLSRIEQKWRYLTNPLPKNEELDRMRRIYQNAVFMLVEKAYPGTPLEKIGPVFEQSGTLLGYMVVMNICLGVEKRVSGLPPGYNEDELRFITFLPIYQLVHSLVKEAQQKHRTSEVEGKEMLENISQLCNLISLVCFDSIAGVLAPKDKQSRKKQSGAEDSRRSSPSASEYKVHVQGIATGVCQNCFQTVPVEKVVFHRIIGLVLFWLHRKVEGNLCYDCAEQFYWKYTCITILFGWWSFGSIIATPIFLIINFFNHQKTEKHQAYSQAEIGSLSGYKFATFFALGLIVFFIFAFLVKPNSTNPRVISSRDQANPYVEPESQLLRRTSVSQLPIPTATRRLIRPTPTPNCRLWDMVTAEDEGEFLCVYGYVKKAYVGETNFFITFGDDPNDFRFIALNGVYFEGLPGNCATAKGLVKVYGKMPYIEVNDGLYKCE